MGLMAGLAVDRVIRKVRGTNAVDAVHEAIRSVAANAGGIPGGIPRCDGMGRIPPFHALDVVSGGAMALAADAGGEILRNQPWIAAGCDVGGAGAVTVLALNIRHIRAEVSE